MELLVRPLDYRLAAGFWCITEPLIGFYHAIMRPVWDQLERPGSARRVWQASRRRFVSNVLGPHFEQICREWTLHHADPDLLGGLPARVGHGTVHDTMGAAHLQRLHHIRDLITQTDRYDTTHTKLLCFSGAGFNDKAYASASASPDIHLIDLPALYGRDRA